MKFKSSRIFNAADVHPFEEAQGFRALLGSERVRITPLRRLAAKTGKAASFIAKRLKLLDLTQPAADAFTAGHIGVEHALLIAKLARKCRRRHWRIASTAILPRTIQSEALCPSADCRRGLSKTSISASNQCRFRKTMRGFCRKPEVAPTARSAPDSTRSLFSEVKDDSCSDAGCFQSQTRRAHHSTCQRRCRISS